MRCAAYGRWLPYGRTTSLTLLTQSIWSVAKLKDQVIPQTCDLPRMQGNAPGKPGHRTGARACAVGFGSVALFCHEA